MSDASSSPAIRLPVWRLVKASLACVFYHLDNFVGRIWPWVAIVAVATAVLGLGLGMTFEENSTGSIVLGLLIFAGSTMVIVSWHRGLLLGEIGGPASGFRIDRPFWRYLGVAIGMSLLVLAAIGGPSLAIGLLFSAMAPAATAAATAAGLAAIALVATLPLTSRLMLAMPMAAIGAAPPLIRGAWRLGRGNGWRLLGALLLLSLICALIQLALAVPITLALQFGMAGEDMAALHGVGPNLVIQPLSALAALFNAGLFASLASYAYAVLTNHPLGREVTG